jgi:prepilin signal peptidase PulO-like enzyme (type II secretory pathway)
VNFIQDVPLVVRLALLFVLGVAVGTQLNRGIYRLALFNPRRIGPWSPPLEEVPPRRWFDYLPVLGWIALRREARWHGRAFWIRPLLLELATGGAYAGLYWWDMQGGPVANLPLAAPPQELLHAQFLMQAVLLSLMIVATFIDFDEQTIPDQITVPGTLAALALAALLPNTRLPVSDVVVQRFGPAPRAVGLEPLLLSSPAAWPAWLDGNDGLLVGLACFVFWVFAIMPFVWTTRRGLGEALRLLLASIVRRRSRPYLVMAAVGCVLIALVWRLGHWHELLSALAGMVFGGALIWAVRIVGTRALRVEAMGYGDVLLMFMIGAFLGWQSVLLIFFIAPFAALAIGLAQLILTRRADIAFGPYLCLATLLLIVGWSPLWNGRLAPVFQQFGGGQIILFLAVGLILMGGMLMVWRLIKERFLLPPEEEPPQETTPPRDARENKPAHRKRKK